MDRMNERAAQNRTRISGKLEELSEVTRQGKERIGEKANEFSAKREQIRQEQAIKRGNSRQRLAETRARLRRPQTPQQKTIRSIYSFVVGGISAVLVLTHAWPASLFEKWGWRLEAGSRFSDFPIFIATCVCVFLVLLPVPLLVIRRYAPHPSKPQQPAGSPVESETGPKDFLD
jgi:hypothetical protein